ncbi:21424_t:CDS:2 [Rhizophagus irregularis]|nr:21424_t:CDS:2 [Rhizophagus irregularis]
MEIGAVSPNNKFLMDNALYSMSPVLPRLGSVEQLNNNVAFQQD